MADHFLDEFGLLIDLSSDSPSAAASLAPRTTFSSRARMICDELNILRALTYKYIINGSSVKQTPSKACCNLQRVVRLLESTRNQSLYNEIFRQKLDVKEYEDYPFTDNFLSVLDKTDRKFVNGNLRSLIDEIGSHAKSKFALLRIAQLDDPTTDPEKSERISSAAAGLLGDTLGNRKLRSPRAMRSLHDCLSNPTSPQREIVIDSVALARSLSTFREHVVPRQIFHLDHVVHGNGSGGKHVIIKGSDSIEDLVIRPSQASGFPVIENIETGVFYGLVELPSSRRKGSSFFPDVFTEDQFIEFIQLHVDEQFKVAESEVVFSPSDERIRRFLYRSPHLPYYIESCSTKGYEFHADTVYPILVYIETTSTISFDDDSMEFEIGSFKDLSGNADQFLNLKINLGILKRYIKNVLTDPDIKNKSSNIHGRLMKEGVPGETLLVDIAQELHNDCLLHFQQGVLVEVPQALLAILD